ncbi:Serum paraoxonase/arylesterase 2 [Vanrija pseudolonga]|uniref:Serum paraoxonase/arylesterase 2 n=1 Tax=Vanrija pseudolonga TaxID=143232 RepID=A0AAF1BQB1_9TREE|nr:Serum paraoxonase/arylesterase 2 [Vanrija pseudolonga]
MPSAASRSLILGVAILALVGRFVYDRLSTFGFFRTGDLVNIHGLTALKHIEGTTNAEDLHYDPGSGLIYAAAQAKDVRNGWFPPLARFDRPEDAVAGGGKLIVIDPKTFTSKDLALEGFTGAFVTHGIDILQDPKRADALYIHAVNHLPNPGWLASRDITIEDKGNSVIEIFHHVVGSDSAQHVRTVQHESIRTPNDLFATGPTSFYVTNDHHYRDGPLRHVEDLGSKAVTPWTDTVHIEADPKQKGKEGITSQVVLSKMHNNNGLGHTTNPKEIIICDAAGGVSYVADIQADRTLKIKDELKFATTIDNPFWFQDPYPEVGGDKSGILNTGLQRAHLLAHEIHDDNSAMASAAWLAVGKPGERKWAIQQLFADDGSQLRSASAGILLAIDPKTNAGKKQAWLFLSGFSSKNVVATKVDL